MSCHRAERSPVHTRFNCLPSIFINHLIRWLDVPWPVHPLNLTAKLKDTANTSAPELSFQCKAVQDYHSHQTEVSQQSQPAENDNCSPSLLLPHAPHPMVPVDTTPTPQTKHTFSSITIDSDDDQPDQCMFSESVSLITCTDCCSNVLQLKKKTCYPW